MTSGYEKSSDYGGREPTKFRILVVCILMLALSVGGVALALASPTTVRGVAQIIDGDTIEIGAQAIRLHGIDAPEVGQRCETSSAREYRCGREAIDYLATLIEGRTVECVGDAFDDFDRLIAICNVDGQDVSSALTTAGWAWAFVRFSDDYIDQERQAQTATRGIWQGRAQPAWEYRADRWNVAAQESPEGCPIKGNISDNGRIYHAPWSPWYTRTSINTARGERWFCSEREALDAGWRAPYWR